MVNTSDFAKRLQQVLDYYELTASAFADSLDVQRSSISHLLSERNKPSLDFILKVVDTYPEIDMYWITKGEGIFPPVQVEKETHKTSDKQTHKVYQTSLFDDESIGNKTVSFNEKTVVANDKLSVTSTVENTKKIKKIIFFYSNNSFEIFENPA